MALKLTVESFVAGTRQSGLIDGDRLDRLVRELRAKAVNPLDADVLAEEMVRRDLITRWQAEKLLQGKFKGFLLGSYRLRELLGRGEMSSIYLAEHTMMKRKCAIKVLPAHKVKDTSYLGRFHREAQAVAALDHPGIVRAYDVGMESEGINEIHYLVMEYVEGRDLEKVVDERRQLKVAEAVEIIRQAAEGLAHAHEAGLIHRDVKPGNILIDDKGRVKLLDLGLARFFRDTDMESLTIKHDEKVLGTADYLAPEQAVDSHSVDERADIYSLGCTMYFTLAGHPPFTDGTLVQRLLSHQTKPPVSIRKLRSDVPESLAAILDKMLAKRKEDRFQKASAVAQTLAKWLAVNAEPASPKALVAPAEPREPAVPPAREALRASQRIAPVRPANPTATESDSPPDRAAPIRRSAVHLPVPAAGSNRSTPVPPTVPAGIRTTSTRPARPEGLASANGDLITWMLKNALLLGLLFMVTLVLIASLAIPTTAKDEPPAPAPPTLQASPE